MELFLLKVVAFVRPIASMEYAEAIFDIAGIGLFGLILFVFLFNSAARKDLRFSSVDALIIAFTFWCFCTYFIYFETSSIRDIAKLLIPLLTYLVAKHAIRDEREYRQLLGWMVVGFSIPVIASVVLIQLGHGVDYVSYWTGLARWQGAYGGAHSFGHSVNLFLFVMALYLHLNARDAAAGVGGLKRTTKMALALLAVLTLYCLYKSQVRSAILGLIVFAGVYFFYYNRKWLLISIAGLAAIGMVSMPYWLPVLLPEVVTMERGVGDISDLGSGRPQYWQHNMKLYAGLPIDRQLAGSGIGNRAKTMHVSEQEVLDSHNDWLDLLMQTGLVGLLLFAALQFALFRKILRLSPRERYAYLALFLAVNLMMFFSNSYVWRIQVGHLYYLILAFIEVRGRTAPSSAVIVDAPPVEEEPQPLPTLGQGRRYARGFGPHTSVRTGSS